jgi:hypothetical protein
MNQQQSAEVVIYTTTNPSALKRIIKSQMFLFVLEMIYTWHFYKVIVVSAVIMSAVRTGR